MADDSSYRSEEEFREALLNMEKQAWEVFLSRYSEGIKISIWKRLNRKFGEKTANLHRDKCFDEFIHDFVEKADRRITNYDSSRSAFKTYLSRLGDFYARSYNPKTFKGKSKKRDSQNPTIILSEDEKSLQALINKNEKSYKHDSHAGTVELDHGDLHQKAIDSLPEKQQLALRLAYLYEYAYDEDFVERLIKATGKTKDILVRELEEYHDLLSVKKIKIDKKKRRMENYRRHIEELEKRKSKIEIQIAYKTKKLKELEESEVKRKLDIPQAKNVAAKILNVPDGTFYSLVYRGKANIRKSS